MPRSASRVVPGAHRVVGPGTHRGSGPREVHTTNSAFVNTLELSNPMVLIRPDQAENAKGKNVIIGEQKHDERHPLQMIPMISATSTLGGARQDQEDLHYIDRSDWYPDRSNRCPGSV
jgi:hypothetical protein